MTIIVWQLHALGHVVPYFIIFKAFFNHYTPEMSAVGCPFLGRRSTIMCNQWEVSRQSWSVMSLVWLLYI